MMNTGSENMGSWNGIADCPKCGSKGTMLVHGETSTLEIDGCWVCGYGQELQGQTSGFLPLQHLRIERKRPVSPMSGS
jgi:Zn ribbon nucleic-acid-binding protein